MSWSFVRKIPKLLIDLFLSSFIVSDRGDTGLGVFNLNQTTPLLDLLFLTKLGTFQLAISTTDNTRFFTAAAGHGIITGNVIELANESNFTQSLVLSVVGDVIEIEDLIGDVYEIGVNYNLSSRDMRVNGSVTPVIFMIKPDAGQIGDINSIKLAIQSASSMDFSTFGSANALAIGCLLRKRIGVNKYINIYNFKTNGSFASRAFEHYFQSKIGGGLFSFLAKSAFNGQQNSGVTIRLDGNLGEELQIVIQDDLSILNQETIVAAAEGSGVQ